MTAYISYGSGPCPNKKDLDKVTKKSCNGCKYEHREYATFVMCRIKESFDFK